MGVQDRDYWRARASRSAFGGGKGNRGLPSWLIWLLIFAGVFGLTKLAKDWKRAEVPFPPTGLVHWYIGQPPGPLARLQIKAPNTGSANYAVRIDSWESKQPIALVPVRSGETATVGVPLGVYRVTMVKGMSWRGPDKMFGFASEAKEAVEPMSFHRTGNTIHGHVIELETLNGNMATRPSRLGY